MTDKTITILPFKAENQPGIDTLMADLADEFPFNFYSADAKKIEDLHTLPGRYYWVAMDDNKIVGTVGIIIQNGYAVLKSMFLHRDYRGADKQISLSLLQIAINHARQANIAYMYLGTMAEFVAAQKFYEKYGFSRISVNELPEQFPANTVDTVFFKMLIINNE